MSFDQGQLTTIPTNTPRGFHVETTWKRTFPRRFNVESTWSVCRVALIKQKEYKSIDDLYYLKIKIICMRRQ